MSAAAAAPSRRACLFGAAAVAAVGDAAVAGAQAVGADAELIELCAAWRRAFDRERAVTNRLGAMLERDWSDEDHALWDETQDAVSELEDRVFGARAITLAGIKAKAGVLAYLDAATGIPAERDQAASLVADIVALAEGAS